MKRCYLLPAMPDKLSCGLVPKWDISNLRHRSCPTCGEDSPNVICVRPDQLEVYQCGECGMIYLAKIPGQSDLANLYKNYGEYKGYIHEQKRPKPYSWLQKIKLCRSHFFIRIFDNFDGLSDVRVCEVGPSYGSFLQLARFRGAKVTGVELDNSAIAYLKERLKIECYHTVPELPEVQDVFCAKSVFEHLTCPGSLLKEISEKLDADGRLLLSMPNGANFETLGPTWAGFRLDMEHLNYWTPKTLAFLLSKHGFYVEQYWELNQLATNRRNTKTSGFNRLFERVLPENNWSPVQTGRATLAVLARRIREV